MSQDPIAFAERVLALLDAGRYTMSYKYATLAALIDCTVEAMGPSGAPPEVLHARDVADRVLELYWRQARPYPGDPDAALLRQGPRARRNLVTSIADLRRAVGFHADLRQAAAADPDGLRDVRNLAFETVVRMPLPKLQRVDADDPFGDGFMFRIDWPDQVSATRVHAPDFDDRIHLKPGVGGMLVRIGGLVRPAVERAWADFVAARNPDLLEESTLDAFLFGVDRTALLRVRGPLTELQQGACFYCHDRLRSSVEVDHFLPWSRCNDDGLDNLVAAHARCNNQKRAHLAATLHLRRWLDRTVTGGGDLDAVAGAVAWPRDAARTLGTARSLYLHQSRGRPLWVTGDTFAEPDHDLLRGALALPLAAESREGYRTGR